MITDRPPTAYRHALQRGQMARAFWLLFWHVLRFKRRALLAEFEREILYGRPGGSVPVGILNA